MARSKAPSTYPPVLESENADSMKLTERFREYAIRTLTGIDSLDKPSKKLRLDEQEIEVHVPFSTRDFQELERRKSDPDFIRDAIGFQPKRVTMLRKDENHSNKMVILCSRSDIERVIFNAVPSEDRPPMSDTVTLDTGLEYDPHDDNNVIGFRLSTTPPAA
ncbi:MAG: hypothetical protein KJ956_14725 [Actinobacteria bacterium]|nr:hypothetical protein [Patescibacteria group bacterium]MBU1495208.1 hypothetical protein [Actinomycetota bacterium]